MTIIRSSSLIALLAAATTLACNEPMSCPTNPNLPTYPHTITISVLDSITGRPIADSAIGRFAWSESSDSLRHDPFFPDSLLITSGGAGTYAVAIVRPGYEQWLRSGIIVPATACGGYNMVAIGARLQPAP